MRSVQNTGIGSVRVSDDRYRLAALRRLVAKVECAGRDTSFISLSLGFPDVDLHLPGAGLACGALHEVVAASYGDGPAAFGFASALTGLVLRARAGSAILIATRRCYDFGKPYGHGLTQLGLEVGRLLLVEARNDKEALWAMEETLRSKAVAVVAGSVAGDFDLTVSRRLSLAAGASGTPLVLLRAPAKGGASAAVTHWRIAAAPAARDRFGTFARPRWNVSLERCRNGRPGRWLLEWDHVAYRFRLARGLADRPPVAGERQSVLRVVV